MDEDEYHHMDQIIPGLWIGDLHSATDRNTLTENNIHSILSVMRGRFSIPEVRPVLLLILIDTFNVSRPSSGNRFLWTMLRRPTSSSI
jgi:dual specificity phosphatase 12